MENSRQKRQYFFLIAAIGMVIGGCSGSEWAKEDKDRLLDRCLSEGGSKSYCKCYLENAMAEYPTAKDMEEIDFESAVELSIGCEY